MLNRFWRWIARLWQRPATPVPVITAEDLAALRDVPPFDWLRDYGPLWWPGCTAFWLDPEDEADKIRWERKYGFMRPELLREKIAAEMARVRRGWAQNSVRQQQPFYDTYAMLQAVQASQIEQLQNAANAANMHAANMQNYVQQEFLSSVAGLLGRR